MITSLHFCYIISNPLCHYINNLIHYLKNLNSYLSSKKKKKKNWRRFFEERDKKPMLPKTHANVEFKDIYGHHILVCRSSLSLEHTHTHTPTLTPTHTPTHTHTHPHIFKRKRYLSFTEWLRNFSSSFYK